MVFTGHLPHILIFLVAVWLLLLLRLSMAGPEMGYNAILPMYEPGAPVTDDMLPFPNAEYGFPLRDLMMSCRMHGASRVCKTHDIPGDDASFCMNLPDYISRTPRFGDSGTSAHRAGFIKIICGDVYGNTAESPPNNTFITYTTNGTLPHIYHAIHRNPVQFWVDEGVEMFVVARCWEKGKHPSRIAYMRRLIDRSAYTCAGEDGWKMEMHHHPLMLPGCAGGIVGLKVCDGQTIVEGQGIPRPHPIQSTTDAGARLAAPLLAVLWMTLSLATYAGIL